MADAKLNSIAVAEMKTFAANADRRHRVFVGCRHGRGYVHRGQKTSSQY
jgi:hypothetical protein